MKVAINPLFTLPCHMQAMTYSRNPTARARRRRDQSFRRWASVVAGVLLCSGSFAHGAPEEPEMKWGYQYLEACSKGSPNRPICLRFVDGFLLGAAWQAKRSNSRLEYCLPEGTGPEIVADAFHDWMVDVEAHSYMSADGLLFTVLISKWPCRTS